MGDRFQYYVFFGFILIMYSALWYTTDRQLSRKRKRPKFLMWSIIALWVLVGMRNVLYGRDTLGYVMHFKSLTTFNWKDSAEPLFTLTTFLVRCVTSNYHVYLLVTSLPLCVALFYFFRQYLNKSYEILAGICVYTLLGILAFHMAAERQSIAVACGIAAFIYADRGKWKLFLLSVGIAFLFHNSSFVLLILYPMRYLDLKKYGIWGVAVFLAISVFASGAVVPFLHRYMPMEDRFSQYGTTYESSQNYTGFILQLILVLIAYFRQDYLNLEEKTKRLFFNTAYVGLAIQSITQSLAELYRLSFYFCIVDIVLVSLALSTYKGKNAKTFRVLFIIGCLVYIFILSGGGVLPLKQQYKINF